MKKILVIIMLVFVFGCSDDATAPEESPIVGMWATTFTVLVEETSDYIDVFVVLKFMDNGNYIVYSNQPDILTFNEEGTYKINDNELKVVNSKCADTEGIYRVEFIDNGLDITQIEDECSYNSVLHDIFFKFDSNTYLLHTN